MNVNPDYLDIVVVEDELFYSKVIYYQLSKIEITGKPKRITVVSSINELQELKELMSPEIILLDLGLGEYEGMDTFRMVKKICPHSGVIILTATDNDTLSIELLGEGALDYVVKSNVEPKLLKKTIEFALERMERQTKFALENIRSKNFFRFSPSPMAIFSFASGKVLSINDALIHYLDCEIEENGINLLDQQMSFLMDENLTEKTNFCIETKIMLQNSQFNKICLTGNKIRKGSDSFLIHFILR